MSLKLSHYKMSINKYKSVKFRWWWFELHNLCTLDGAFYTGIRMSVFKSYALIENVNRKNIEISFLHRCKPLNLS